MGESKRGLLGRVTRRLAAETGRADADAAIRRLAEAQREMDVRLAARFGELRDLLAQRASSKDAVEILHAIRALGTQLRRDGGGEPEDGGKRRSNEARLNKLLDGLAASAAPIVVGPWTGEVGFELLYWIPFLAWARSRWRLAEERFVIVSRGGTASWYGMPGARYVDIFDLATADEFRQRTDPDAHKQRKVSAFDQHLVDSARARLGLGEVAHLHPSVLYRNLAPFWQGEAGVGALERLTWHRRFDAAAEPRMPGLPDDYVAVRFYASDCFPDTAATRGLARQVIDGLAARTHVVVLASGLRIDDHADLAAHAGDRVTVVSAGDVPARNLAVQTAIIAHARGFVGTYGGFSYLAPLYGVPAVAFYAERAFELHHLHAAQWAFDKVGAAALLPVDVRDAALVAAVTAQLA